MIRCGLDTSLPYSIVISIGCHGKARTLARKPVLTAGRCRAGPGLSGWFAIHTVSRGSSPSGAVHAEDAAGPRMARIVAVTAIDLDHDNLGGITRNDTALLADVARRNHRHVAGHGSRRRGAVARASSPRARTGRQGAIHRIGKPREGGRSAVATQLVGLRP